MKLMKFYPLYVFRKKEGRKKLIDVQIPACGIEDKNLTKGGSTSTK